MNLSDFWIGFICGGGVIAAVWFAVWLTKTVSSLLDDVLNEYGK